MPIRFFTIAASFNRMLYFQEGVRERVWRGYNNTCRWVGESIQEMSHWMTSQKKSYSSMIVPVSTYPNSNVCAF